MFKFLKNTFKSEESGVFSIPCQELPGWLDGREQQLREDLASRTADARNRIVSARERLLALVDSLSAAGQQEAHHPKLGQVTKNTLPLFEKAMHSACSRKLPEEPEEFYKAVAESLKGCISSLKGQGRYIQGVYPTETYRMRLIIDEIGKEVNSITPVIAEIRDKRAVIREMRLLHTDLLRIHAIAADTGKTGAVISGRITSLEEDLTTVRAEQAGMEASSSSGDVAGIRRQVEDAGSRLDEAARDLAGVINVILHVFRKAEKMAGRRQDTALTKSLKSSVSVIERYESAGGEEVIGAVTASLPRVLEMIGSGDIALKNKEEKAVFAGASQVISSISSGFERYQQSLDTFQTLNESIAAHPHTRRQKEIEHRLRHLEMKCDEAKAAQKEYEERVSDARAALPGIRSRLDGMIAELGDRETRYSISYAPEPGNTTT
jgi:predicted  nucleic acid-binding Zn-ribbon protein